MLNLSNSEVDAEVNFSKYEAYSSIVDRNLHNFIAKIMLGVAIFLVILLFLPWTQTIQGNGYVTTLRPEQRPQTIQSPIPGRIEKWYVSEGDFVNKGDTILHISEVKSEYFDPNLIERTDSQINSKNQSASSYQEKVNALRNQLQALRKEQGLKLKQTRNKLQQARLKIKSDSIALEAARVNQSIAENQFDRIESLYEEGLKSRLDYEIKQSKLQEAQAKVIDLENKLLTSENELLNAQMEINRIEAEYENKISKTESEVSSTLSSLNDTEAQVSKLENSRSNYEVRRGMYYIKAPQDGYINKALISGIGETFKEGEKLVNIMPSNYQIAVETYVRPIDLPLLQIGDHVRVQFDGWPAIVFSGWPNASYGTYGAEVVAIENFISSNGKYRVLLSPDHNSDYDWPKDLRVGSGARTLALLDDVPVWYEIWRQLNGFPPNYYKKKDEINNDVYKSNLKK
ncbi:HlyD family secretion protein [Mesonia aquimarina]|uniref:HlyD family secretion protein n=1 Tax=Mesonia aquimarina TaxID=1504967 RepID=UPI000EF62456|nr:HlyD family efflux transporter periplasmic adaptor subunit [Mesonia aquimarina]